jgi:Amt family ammonium transporter
MAPPQTLKLPPGAPPPRILVVDDFAGNRLLMVRLLVPAGFTVREADNGEEAVEIAEEWLPHAVMMDLQMPVLDGVGATRAIKATVWGNPIPVIVISGTTDEVNVSEALSAGAMAFIPKPFDEALVLATLGRALGLTYA